MQEKAREGQALMQAMGLGGPAQGPEGQPQQAMMQQQPADPSERIRQIATNPQAMLALTAQNPKAAYTVLKMYGSMTEGERDARKLQAKRESKIAETKQAKLEKYAEFEPGIRRLRQLIPYTGDVRVPGKAFLGTIEKGGKFFHPTAVQRRAEFDTIGKSYQGIFRDMESKGQFPSRVFEELLKNIPKAELSEAENLGRIDALQRILESHFSGKPTYTGEYHKKTGARLSKEEKTVMVRSPKGNWVPIPQSEVNDALRGGGSLK